MNHTEENKYQKKILTIPNLLSLFRLCLIPVIVWLYVVEKNDLWATLMLILSGLTDMADGFIARKFHMISDFGKIFDPIADKMTQFVMLLCLFTRFPHMMIPAALMVVKELAAGVTGLMMIHRTGVVEGADWHGKMTTAALYTMMGLHFIWIGIPQQVSVLMVLVCTGLMILSAVLYCMRNLKAFFSAKEK